MKARCNNIGCALTTGNESLLPDGQVVCSMFGYVKRWKFPHYNNLQKLDQNIAQLFNKASKMAKFSKSGANLIK